MEVTTKERLIVIETKLETICSDITDIKESLKIHGAQEELRYNAMKREFAAKWAERALYAIIMILVGISFKIMVGG